ncbi:MAG: glycosyltransferase family 2 protein [Vicinamibacterales bacterium]
MAGLQHSEMNEPFEFSIIIPTFERPKALARCLDALCHLDHGADFEVLLVDDGGGIPLEPAVAAARGRLSLSLIRQDHAGPAAARNIGARHARGRWLAFTDDDCEPDPRWLSMLARRFAKQPDAMLGGRVLNGLKGNVYCAAHQLLVDYSARHLQRGTKPFVASSNMAMPAKLFHEVGGFDTSFPFAGGEDRDLCARWRAAGYTLSDAPEAVVRHRHPLRLGSFCRLHFRYGRGARRFHGNTARRAGARVHLEPVGFYLGLLLSPLSNRPTLRSPFLCAALVLSQVCHAVGYAREKWSESAVR